MLLRKAPGWTELVDRIESLPYQKWFSDGTLKELDFVTERKIRDLTEEDIDESGYVVDTLYTALFSLIHAENFEMSIRNAVNLGYDTDTAGAVTGTAAGLLYGKDSIPRHWLNDLKKREYLEGMAFRFSRSLASEDECREYLSELYDSIAKQLRFSGNTENE